MEALQGSFDAEDLLLQALTSVEALSENFIALGVSRACGVLLAVITISQLFDTVRCHVYSHPNFRKTGSKTGDMSKPGSSLALK